MATDPVSPPAFDTPHRSDRQLDPLAARKTCRTVEPLHGMIYFAEEAREAYARLGLRSEAGYFASRAAAMGAVEADTVVATFFNFYPGLVRAAIPEAWDIAPPAEVLAARLGAADASLRRMLGALIDAPEMVRAASLARSAAERAAARYEGRPLFAAHAALPWPDPPHLQLWHAQTLLREYRGDGHIAALVLHDLDPVEALGLHLATGDLPEAFLKGSRGWPDELWEAGIDRLVGRGLVTRVEPTDTHRATVALTDRGAGLRDEIETATDQAATYAYEALGEEGCSELRTLARPFSRAVVEAAGLGF